MMTPRREILHDPPANITDHHHPKRQRMNNAHFDHMIQSMSAVNRDRRQRKESSDAYIPFKSITASELSFIKNTDTLRSSSASKASSGSSVYHHTCNPLPQWLVNTFMKLSKKNPLRLLLPPDVSESAGNGVIHTQTKTAASPTDVSATGPSFAYNLPEPSIIQAQKSKYLISLPQTSTPVVTDEDRESWREPLPFSTPGPGSLLGSSVASSTVFSLPVPQKHLSPVSYENIHLPSSRSHTPIYPLSSDPTTYFDPYIETFVATDDVGSSKNPSKPEENRQSLFSNIFSTPGPGYYAPRPVHFDSSLEDLVFVSSDPLKPAYEIDYDAIDFHWKPFDRKHLVVPQEASRSQKPIYTSGPTHYDFASDTSEYEPAYVARPANTAVNTYISPASPLQSISPTPFRFLLPPETDASVFVPESQVQNTVQEPSTPKESTYFALPGVYISPLALDEDRKVYDTATVKKHAGHHNVDASIGVEQVNSQASNDSIESWEEDLF